MKTILLVDDEELVATAQAQAIRRLGYKCLVAHSGEAAVQQVAGNPEIALVLLDTDLGKGIDSREAAQRILAVRELPIVFMASHPERRKPGVSGLPSFRYVPKDSGDVEMQGAIESALELFVSQQEARKSDEWQRLILATVPAAIYVSPLDPTIDASWVSGDIEKATGFTPGQYMADKDFWRKRLHPDDRERVLNSYRDPAAGDEKVNEYRWLCNDGRYRWFFDRAIKKHTPQGIQYVGIILDITERMRSEEKLNTSEVRYRRLFETAKDGILIMDAQTGTIIDVNPYLSELLGFPADEICGKKIWELGSFRDFIASQAHFLELQQKGYIRYEDLPLESADGKQHLVEFISNVYQVDRDLVIQCNIRDISERKLAENIIHARLRLIEYSADHSLAELLQKTLDEVCAFTDSPIGFYHFVETDQVTLSLQAWSTRTLQEFCTATGTDLHYPIDQAGVWADCIRQRRPVIHNDYAALPNRKGLPEGHALVKRQLVVPILREQKIVAVLGIGNKGKDYTEKDINVVAYFTDVAWEITRRKRAEDSLRQANLVVENSPVVVFCWKASEGWPVAMVSQNVSQFGYTPEELLSGATPYAAMVYPEDLDRVAREVQEHSRSGTNSFYQEYRIVTKDGRIRWIEDSTVIERDINGQPLNYQGVIIDITDRKNAETAFAEEHLQLQKTLDEVRTLRGIVPICANCKQIRDDKGFWNEVEKYVSAHTNAEFSHGICPKCMKELYPEFAEKLRKNKP